MSKFWEWGGIAKSDAWKEEYAKQLKQVFGAAKLAQWDVVSQYLNSNGLSALQLLEPDDLSFNTLLHYAVLTNAHVEMIDQFVQEVALTRRNAQNQTVLDIAREHEYTHLYSRLEPDIKYDVSVDYAYQLEQHFHVMLTKTIRRDWIELYAFQLPQVSVLLEQDTPYGYFPIHGSYGGFKYWLKRENSDIILLSHVASRVQGGSDQMHKMTTIGYELIAKGYEAADLFQTEFKEKLQSIKKDLE